MRTRKASFVALLAVVVTAFAIPSAAQAQDTSQVQPQVQQEVGQAPSANPIAALNNISAEIAELKALIDLTAQDVQVVRVDDLQGVDMNALNNALNNNQADVAELQNVLNQNDVIVDALNQNQVAVSDVVAADVLSGGEVVVFVQASDM